MKKKIWICGLVLVLLAVLGGAVLLGINGYVVLSTRNSIIEPQKAAGLDADCILVLQQGKITEKGNHEELINLGGFYSTLYNAQKE